MRPLTPLFNEEIRRGAPAPVPHLRPSFASGALTDGRDTAAGTATSSVVYDVTTAVGDARPDGAIVDLTTFTVGELMVGFCECLSAYSYTTPTGWTLENNQSLGNTRLTTFKRVKVGGDTSVFFDKSGANSGGAAVVLGMPGTAVSCGTVEINGTVGDAPAGTGRPLFVLAGLRFSSATNTAFSGYPSGYIVHGVADRGSANAHRIEVGERDPLSTTGFVATYGNVDDQRIGMGVMIS